MNEEVFNVFYGCGISKNESLSMSRDYESYHWSNTDTPDNNDYYGYSSEETGYEDAAGKIFYSDWWYYENQEAC